MQRLLLVCLGGAVGSGARYLLAGWVHERAGGGFPWGTLAVNVIGSLALGALVQTPASPNVRLALGVGVLGGFTTYSAFNQEALECAGAGEWRKAAVYAGTTLVACLAAGALGAWTARRLGAS